MLTVLFVVGIGFTAWYLRTRERIGFAAVLVVSVLFEVIASRAYFKPYAFMNQPPPGGVVFSHFNHQDLAAADAIARELGRGAVLVSDPKTMGLIGARSGLNSLVSYSNVNTMADDTRRELVSFLRQVLQGTPDLKICTGLRRISDAYASGQLNYGQLRLRAGEQAEMDVLEVLGYNNALVPRPVGPPRILRLQSQNEEEAVQNQGGSIVSNGTLFAVIVSPDTLDWIDHPFDPSYFPAQRHVTKIENVFQHGSSGRMIDHFFLLKLKCQ